MKNWVLILMVCCLSCGDGQQVEQGQESDKRLQVEALVAKAVHFRDNITTTANILPYEQVELKAPLDGTVLSIHFEEGSRVKKGDLLVRIDDRVWLAQLQGLEAQLRKSRKELERKQALLKIEGASQEEVDEVLATVQDLESQVQHLRVTIDLANVRAPFTGVVSMRNFSVGSFLSKGDLITILTQSGKLKIEFNLPGQYRGDIKENNTVRIVAGNDSLEATVYAIDPVISSSSRTVKVRAKIEQNEAGFVPGEFAWAIVNIKTIDNALLLPTEVVIPELAAQTVYLYKNGKALRREIILGGRTEKDVHILKGVAAGDTIITTGLLEISDGLPVKLKTIKTQP